MFNSTGPHRCPDCKPEWAGKNLDRRCDEPLELLVSNYSGTGVDIAECPRCHRNFEIRYKVDTITRCD